MPEPSRFQGRPGTPVGELGSFTSTAEVSASLEDLTIVVKTEGTYIGSAFQCEQTIDVGGLRIGMSVIATPDAVWIDSGQGFEESGLLDPEVDTVIAICAANPGFWTDFAPFPSLEGEPDSVNGIPAQRVELTELLGALSALGFEDISGVEFEGAVVWIAEEGGWLAQIDMTFTVEPEAAAALFGVPIDLSEPARLDFVVTVAAPDDPGLTVDVPSMVDG